MNFQELKTERGVHFSTGYAPQFLTDKSQIALDGELLTEANSGVLSLFTTYVEPRVIKTAVTPLKIAQIFPETMKGTWVDDITKFPVSENTGEVASYGDFNNNGVSGVNVNWETRESYHYQVITQVGERELARAGAAKLDWAAMKQESAVMTLNRFQQKTYLFGVEGLLNYGILNDPSLLPSIASTSWDAMDGQQVYNEVLKLVKLLVTQTDGLIDPTNESMKLVVSPSIALEFNKTNTYNVNVYTQLKTNFPNMVVETVPEYKTNAGNMMQLVVNSYDGVDTVEPTFTEKLRTHRMVMDMTSWKQKRSQGTWGTIIYRPIMIASMLVSI